MAKDTQKNRYFAIGIARDSWVLSQIEADAKEYQMDDQPAKLIVQRLIEYYKLVERGVIVPGVTAMMQPVQMPASTLVPMNGNGHASNGASNGRSKSASAAVPAPAPAIQVVQEPEHSVAGTVGESETAADNADAALDFFSMDDDD